LSAKLNPKSTSRSLFLNRGMCTSYLKKLFQLLRDYSSDMTWMTDENYLTLTIKKVKTSVKISLAA
jgi:hypothetical protein